MTLTQRDKNLLVGMVFVVLIVGYWFFSWRPQHVQLTDKREQLARIQSDLQNQKSQLNTAQSYRNNYAAEYAKVVEMGQAIPEDDDVPSLLIQLEGLAGKKFEFSQVEVRKYPQPLLLPSNGQSTQTGAAGGAGGTSAAAAQQPQSTSATGGAANSAPQSSPFQAVKIRLQFQGSFLDLPKFLADVRNLVSVSNSVTKVKGRLIFVEGIRVKEGREGYPSVSVNIGAMIFSLPPGDTLTTTGGSSGATSVSTNSGTNGATSTSVSSPRGAQ